MTFDFFFMIQYKIKTCRSSTTSVQKWNAPTAKNFQFLIIIPYKVESDGKKARNQDEFSKTVFRIVFNFGSCWNWFFSGVAWTQQMKPSTT